MTASFKDKPKKADSSSDDEDENKDTVTPLLSKSAMKMFES